MYYGMTDSLILLYPIICYSLLLKIGKCRVTTGIGLLGYDVEAMLLTCILSKNVDYSLRSMIGLYRHLTEFKEFLYDNKKRF